MNFFKVIFLFLIFSKSAVSCAQEIDSFAPVVRVKYIANHQAKLRFIPRNFFEMRAIAKSGLKIKVTQIVDAEGKSTQIEKIIEIDTPQSNLWLKAKSDKQIAAMAAAIFSQFKGKQTDEFLSIRERVDFQNNLHLFAITASSFSWEAAKLANLGVDIDLDEKAIYKISYELKRPNKFCPNKKQTLIYAAINEVEDKSQLLYQPGDLFIQLKWPKSNQYFAFDIEKKSQLTNNEWKQTNSEPLLPSSGNDSLNPFFHVVVDSTFKNYQSFAYRVFGYDVFGERKLISTELTNAYSRDLTPPPAVSQLNFTSKSLNQIDLSWAVSVVPDSRKIKIYYANNNRGPFKLIKELKSESNNFRHDSASHFLENFYVISTVDSANNENPTLPFSAITLDTIPPPVMFIKSVNVNKQGVVKIVWNPSNSNDLGGYRLSRSFENPNQWSSILGGNYNDTIYFDTIPLKSIKGNVFYGVKAIDLRGNIAHGFIPFKISAPDLNAPPRPIIYDIQSLQNGHLKLFMHFDSSDTKWIQFRKRELISRNPTDWSKWTPFEASKSFEDTSSNYGKWYEYQVKAIDDSDNQSDVSNIFGQRTILKPISLVNLKIQALQKTVNSVKIVWNSPTDKRITRIEVYRIVPNQLEQFVSSVDINKLEFTDIGAPRMQFCKYRFKIISIDGQSIEFGSMIEILMKD